MVCYNLLTLSRQVKPFKSRLTSIPACRKNRCAEKNDRYFDLKYLKSMHTLISPTDSYKLCSVATPGYPKPLLLENRIYIIALTLDLQRVSFYSIRVFLYHNSTTELILFLILLKESHPGSKALPLCRKSSLAFYSCCGEQIHA